VSADDRGDTSIWCHDGVCAACEDGLCEHDCHYEDDEPRSRAAFIVGRLISSVAVVLFGAAAVIGIWRKAIPLLGPVPPLTALALKGLALLLVGALTIRTVMALAPREEQSA
jgi:hypothetical protein